MRPHRRIVAMFAIGALVATAAPLVGAPDVAAQQCGTDLASANPRISVDRTTLPAQGTSTVTVRGSGYLTGPYQCGSGRYGGVYAFFGWVEPGSTWGPSHRSPTSPRGQFGATYSYPGAGGGGDTRDDGSGTVRLVSFTAGGTSGNETPYHMDGGGNWSAPITVRGATYSWSNVVTGQSRTVDCTVVQCGVFTIGAHGVASRSNERFTPIAFQGAPAAPAPAPGAPGGGGVGAPAGGGGGGAGGSATQVEGATTTPGADAPGGGAERGADDAAERTDETSPSDDPAAAATSEEADDAVRTEQAASLQTFDEASGGGAPLWLVPVAAAVLVAGGAFFTVRRRRRARTVEVTP